MTHSQVVDVETRVLEEITWPDRREETQIVVRNARRHRSTGERATKDWPAGPGKRGPLPRRGPDDTADGRRGR